MRYDLRCWNAKHKMNGRPEETDMIAVDEQMLASLKLDTEKNSKAVLSESHPYQTKKKITFKS